jgi:hypothetical protein
VVPVALYQGISPGTIVQEGEWAPGPVWMDMDKRKQLAPNVVRTPDRPTRSESLIENPIQASNNIYGRTPTPCFVKHLSILRHVKNEGV